MIWSVKVKEKLNVVTDESARDDRDINLFMIPTFFSFSATRGCVKVKIDTLIDRNSVPFANRYRDRFARILQMGARHVKDVAE